MVSAQDIGEFEAFLPPVPDEGRGHWPPATREIAKEWAREARLRERGLAVDDATLERVADVVMDPAYDQAGLYYTPEELDDELPIGLSDVVDEYLDRRPAGNGGVEFGWRDGRQVLFVGIVGDLEPHRAALARMGGDRVILEPRPRTVAELEAVAVRLEQPQQAQKQELAAAGLELERRSIYVRPERGVVEVLVVGGVDDRAAAAFFAARYGAAVEVRWLGPSWLREVPHAFGSWTSEGRLIRVFFGIDHNGEQRGNARVSEETADRVVIELTRLQPVGLVTRIGGYQPLHADVELREPVGARTVIDASAGTARPSLAQLGLPRKRPSREWPPRPRKAPAIDPRVPTRGRRARVWLRATERDATYDAMLPAGDPPLDENGEPIVRPAVRRDVLEAIRCDIGHTMYVRAAERVVFVGGEPIVDLRWVGDVLVVELESGDEHAFRPGPDGLYEVARLARLTGSEWIEADPPLPDGPIDADTAVDLLERAQRGPTLDRIFRRLDLDALKAALPRITRTAIRDAVDDQIAERTHGTGPMVFRSFLRELERNTSDDRAWHAYYLQGNVEASGPEAALALVPDAGERVLALLRTERDWEARGELAIALGRLGHRPAIPDLIALLDNPHRYVRTKAAAALGALRAGEATSALQGMLASEPGRTDPPPERSHMPAIPDKQAARDVRAALLEISGLRYEPPAPPADPRP